MTAAPEGDGRPGPAGAPGPARPAGDAAAAPRAVTFDRHLVLDSLGGWRGMLDATLPTVAFIVANSVAGLQAGIGAALVAAVLVFGLRLVRRESVQQAVSGLFGVAIAVAIAAASGQARDFFVPGLIRNAALGVVLIGSIAFRWPLVGVVAEFLAPSHLGAMASTQLPGLRRRAGGVGAAVRARPDPDPATGERPADPEPERHWRDDPRMVRAYSWLTLMWGAVFLLRVAVQWVLYRADEVELLGTASLVLGLPVTAVEVAVTFWVVSRLHRHRAPQVR
ncbi:DUF3159 domain-containing protein [Geodermatophilus sp. DSM 44513]|uniref:DUF3159 domain-containing protein n=1 Tax=Geodermatophilus sp. DSM 44513 TaxID=1528104 RepID=UPI001272CF45|nr:DUF3159 domain-containing protein [Geodermatophilus sp. DSM 44513]WNV73989.1 DUF3159 domain-containing protein [Geodermatophilus sp. DSM 44513]